MLRLRFVLQEIDYLNHGYLKYRYQHDRAYLDEKWFKLNRIKRKQKVFINSPEIEPERMQNKANPTQVMFTAVISQPRDDFDGKLTLVPHVEEVPAQRNSANRPAGTFDQLPALFHISSKRFWTPYSLLPEIFSVKNVN